ncbi:MAG: cytochrome c [Variibacter sp.]|nr:cytochrome c [Variibacter sp.]
MSRPIYLALLVLFGLASHDAAAADAQNGQRLAERWCASCHIVSSTQSRGADNAPSFASMAERPDFTAQRLAFFLLDPHPLMPSMSLNRKEAEDIAAYIVRLKK